MTDISNERCRDYVYPHDVSSRVHWPVTLTVTESGDHIITTTDGTTHQIWPGWTEVNPILKEIVGEE